MVLRIVRRHLLLALMLYAVYVGLTVYVVVFGEGVPWNRSLFFAVFDNRVSSLTPVLVVLSTDDYGRAFFWIPVALVLWFLGGRYRRASVVMVSAFVLSLVLGELMKHVMYEPRPFLILNVAPLIHEQADSSYPSGHALIVGTGAYSVIATLPWYVWLPLTVEALLVSYGRVYVGVHWPLDVIAGWVLGIANTELVLALPQYQEFVHWVMRRLLGWLSYRPEGPSGDD